MRTLEIILKFVQDAPLNMSNHIQIIKSSVRRPRPLVRSIRTASETAFGQNALSDALGDHPEVCVT